MSKFIIKGGNSLAGSVRISGSKNSTLPLIAGSLLLRETRLSNIPRIKDVEVMLEMIGYLGGQYSWKGDHELYINTGSLEFKPLPELARKLRASILFAGPLLARFGRAELPQPGGDLIGVRPIDTHLNSFRALGVEVTQGDSLYLKTSGLKGARIVLEESSVTATENLLLLAAGVAREVEIRLAATEPHVQDLCRFLISAGVNIDGVGTTTLKIKGGAVPLESVSYRVIPDELEVSALAVLAAATRGEVSISPVEPEYIDAVLLQLEKMNVNFRLDSETLKVFPPVFPYKAFRIQSGLYPKLVTDHLPPFAVLATQAEGTSLVHEWLYEARQSYIRELMKMGANAVIMDPHRSLIIGPTALYGKEVASYDIRSGMTLVIAALAAKGETVISGIEHIDRGYEKLEERLRGIGADITRVN